MDNTLSQTQKVNNILENKKNNSQQRFISKNDKSIYKSNQSKLVNSNNNFINSKFVNSNILPNETFNTIKPIKESDASFSKIIPQETYNSIYPISESKNNNKTKILPQQTTASVYPISESKNNKVAQSSDKDYLNIVPQETIKSVYHNNINASSNNNNTLIIPQETIKSIYI